MARITIEDCLGKIPNRFDVSLVAAERAREIMRGSAPLVAPNRDKPSVIALREIAAGLHSNRKPSGAPPKPPREERRF